MGRERYGLCRTRLECAAGLTGGETEGFGEPLQFRASLSLLKFLSFYKAV